MRLKVELTSYKSRVTSVIVLVRVFPFNVVLTLICIGLKRKTIKHSGSLITCGEDLLN